MRLSDLRAVAGTTVLWTVSPMRLGIELVRPGMFDFI